LTVLIEELALSPYLDDLEDVYRQLSDNVPNLSDVDQSQLHELLKDVRQVTKILNHHCRNIYLREAFSDITEPCIYISTNS